MTGLVDNVAGIGKSWNPDFTGPALVVMWGGGQSGASGQAFTVGGKGGDSGWLCISQENVAIGTAVSYTIGAGGAQRAYTSGGAPGNPGGDSYFGGGTSNYAPGGGSTATPHGRAQIPNVVGTTPGSGDWNGANGAAAPSQGSYVGGAGGVNGTQASGTPGSAPGGGGSGGGQAGGGYGAAGGPGGIIIAPFTDVTLPGYNLVGVTEAGVFTASAGTYDDFTPAGDGLCYFEAVGGGGGGKGGNSSTLQGGHGGAGGAWMYRLRTVFRDVTYRRIVPAGGTGTAAAFGAGTPATAGSDASWTLTPLRAVNKRLTSNVAWVSTCAPGSSTPQKHGLLLGETVVIAGVDATFDGSYTVTRVDSAADYDATVTYAAGARVNISSGAVYVSIAGSNTAHTPASSPTWWVLDKADRLAVGYTKTAADVASTAVTPASTSVTLSAPFLLAKAGNGATGNYNTGTLPAGGSAAAGTGDGGADGGRGCYVRAGGIVNTQDGGGSGGGSLPLGGDGAWGGGSVLNTSGGTSKVGDTGITPGGGGGGGAGVTAGTGGPGAIGGCVVRWVLELHGVWIPGGQRKSVTRVKVWTGSPGSEVGHTVSIASVWAGPAGAVTKHSPHRVLTHPESLKRSFPSYLSVASGNNALLPFFDRVTGTFNWHDGVGQKIRTALASNNLDIIVFGDSVAEGWNSYDGGTTGTQDFAKSFNRMVRDQLVGSTEYPSLTHGGTGMIRSNTVQITGGGTDPQWSFSGWSKTTAKHYMTSSTIAHVATFTPGLDSNGVQLTGDTAAVMYSGGGITVKNAAGTVIGTGAATAGEGVLARLEIAMGSVAGHVIKINPTTTTQVDLFSASVYKAGLRVHNLAQGGTKAAGGTTQDYWGPASAMTAPTNMTACYTQGKCYPSISAQRLYLIFLGGNDSNAGTSAADISDAHGRMIDMIHTNDANAVILLMPDAWTADRNVALMNLCRTKTAAGAPTAMIDFFYLSRGLTEIFGKSYNGDVFGHLSDVQNTGAPSSGQQWVSNMLRAAYIFNPG